MPLVAEGRPGPVQENTAKLESGPASSQPAEDAKKDKAQEKAEMDEMDEELALYLANLPKALRKLGGFHQSQKALLKRAGKMEDGLEEPCGIGLVVIPCFQMFNNIRCFMVFYCILLLSQGVAFGLVDLSITNFQKDYNLKPIENFALAFSYDVSSGLVAIFIAYYGERDSKIKWIVVSSFLLGFGSLLFALPFINSRYNQQRAEIEDICEATKVIDTCQENMLSFKLKYLVYFIIGQTVQGIAGMPLYTLGITLLDDSVKTHSLGIYLGIADASSTLGYALGYVLGAPLVQTSKKMISKISIGIVTQRQIWSWWSNFLFAALLAWSTLIPLLCFPNSISGTEEIKAEKQKQPQFLYSTLKDTEHKTVLSLPSVLWNVMKNPVFWGLALSKATESLVMIGASEFLPIYIENQFILLSRSATIISGLILLPGSALGKLLGGVIISKLKMSYRAFMIFIIVTSVVSIALLGLILFIHCDPGKFAGITEDYAGTGMLGKLTSPCNEKCRCSTSVYSSVCGRNYIEYFSPCFAGCTHSKIVNELKMYYNCSCIKEGLMISEGEGVLIDALPGRCDAKCYKLPLLVAFFLSIIIFSGFSDVPLTMVIIRTLPDKLRSVALGMSYVTIRIFGTIPGPLLFKSSGEDACSFRDMDKCGRTGRCWIHDKTKIAHLLVGICSFCKVLTVIFTTISFIIYNRFLKKDSHTLPMSMKKMKAKSKNKEKM
ncbi:solute carrier organic anion transporter family member 6A1 [Microcebus murinus]|uniref:solute carrier organic anion transporter family member 6A1 n=1 Tax=Microcebus murinus TaxID=30608 RepID=UPI003F6C33D3